MSAEQTNEWRKSVQPLIGNLVTVREVTATDAPTLFEALTDPRVRAHISPPPPSISAFEGFIAWARRERALGNSVAFGIVPRGLQDAVGLIQVHALEPTFFAADWGFVLSASFWSTGVFQEAARLVVGFAFDVLKVHRLEARAVSDNSRANGALRKLGADTEAVLAKAFKRGEHYDEQLLWSLIATDWQAVAASPSRHTTPQVKRRIKEAVAESQQQLNQFRMATASPPTLYPFFVADNRPTPVCPTCGIAMTSRVCPNC